ncbi:CBP4 [Candida oxycetoniae]|uniref:Cytochrome b mRNA-processing protein 4 n=1 Tax=Candida oxycetoniae TaxID=497107 RepID=A0AAI9WZW3_9ASCO|nr:CBP4 [Candida oxycetoniae]KAI3406836.1 CBP4 [Candida oxycetoniae]
MSSQKPLWYRWARVYFAGGCIVGVGVLLYKTIIPTDEQLISQFSPEIRAHYEQNKELRELEQEKLIEIVKKTSASNDPIWKTGPIGSPLEKDQRNLSLQLVDKELFHQTKAKEAQQREISQSLEDIKEVEKLLNEKKRLNGKHWWKWW